MKKLFTSFKLIAAIFFLSLFITNSGFGQLLTEDFSYSAGALLTANGWTAHSGAGSNAITVTSPGLTYAGYIGSGIGNAVTLTTSGEDDNKVLSSSQNSGSLYMSCMVKVTSSTTTGDYFLHFIQGTSSFYGRLFVKKDASGNLAFGITRGSGTANYTGFNYSLNTTYLIVIKYTFVTGTTNDVADLFINPVINGTEPSPTITNNDLASTDAASIAGVALRQGTASSAPVVAVDGIRAGTSWNSVVPLIGTPSISTSTTTLTFPLTMPGVPSSSLTYTVSGTNLTDPIVIAPPQPFEISTDNSTWVNFKNSISLSPTLGNVPATTIYVRFYPGGVGSYSGNITHSSTGATTQNVAVSGICPSLYYYNGSGELTSTLSWGTNPDGSGSNPPDFSTNYQIFNLVNSSSINLNSDWIVSGTSSKVVLGNGTDAVSFTISATNSLTGTIDLNSNSSLILLNTTVNHTYGTISSSSIVNFAQSGTYVIPSATYGNLFLTGGTKTFSSGNTTVLGNLTVDNVTGFNGSASPFSTVNLAGNFTLLNNTTFGPETNRLTLVCNGTSTQTLTGNNNDFNLFRITLNNSAGVTLSNTGGSSNLTLGNASGGGYTLTTGNLNINNNTLSFYTGGKAIIQSGSGTLTCGPLANINISGNGTTSIGTMKFTSGSETINNLSINITGTSDTVSLGTSLIVNGTLTLTSGKLILGANNLTLGNSSTISGNPSLSSFVDANGTGQLLKGFSDVGSFTYPLGNRGATPVYSPATLTFTSGSFSSATVGVSLANLKYSNNNSIADYLKRSWTVNQTGVSGFSCDVAFQYDPVDVAGTEANIYFGKYSTMWEILGIADAVNHRLVSSGITGFSTFTGGELNAMPVELISFNASVQKQSVKLNWSTSSETNNKGFEILRSPAGSQSWGSVGFVKGAGTKSTISNYSFSDNLSSGKYIYRLKQIDINGNFVYHELATVVEVETPKKFELSQNYPNPFNPTTKIDYALPMDGKIKLVVYDVLGREVLKPVDSEHKAGYYTVEINSSKLSSGIYFYRLTVEMNGKIQTLTKRMLMIK